MSDTTEVTDVVVAIKHRIEICLEKHRFLSKMKPIFLADEVGVIDDVDGRISDGFEIL